MHSASHPSLSHGDLFLDESAFEHVFASGADTG
jgi:hypothetical protein